MMTDVGAAGELTVLIAEDDDGHAELIMDNLREAGVLNRMRRFKDGQETLDFFFAQDAERKREKGRAYLLLLDIRMPKVDGVEVLRRIKADPEFRDLPIVMLTTPDDPREIKNCYSLGCNCYVTKPVQYDRFAEMLRRLGLFVVIVQVPGLEGEAL